jgi:DNA polymerase-3 subunit delta'
MEDADRLTEPAANALLKAIEEPGLRTVWLLCAPALQDVIPTLRSRCRHIQLHTPRLDDIVNSLIHQNQAAPLLADFAARASFGHVGRARLLATSEAARENRRIVLALSFHLESIATTFRAAQKVIDLANIEASVIFEAQNELELSKLQEAYGKGATGRGMATGGIKAVRELEKEQKARASRMILDSVDGNLLLIATFFRDVMLTQFGSKESIINVDIREQIENYARKTTLHSTIDKIGAIFDARIALANQSSPLLICEALMCQLAKK